MEISLTEVELALGQLRKMGCLFVTLTGGEVFLRREVFELLGVCVRLRLAVQILTNGTLIDRQVANRLAKFHNISGVSVSFYGAFGKVHDFYTRQRGSFARTLRACRMLRRRQLPVVVKFIVMEGNASQYEGVRRLARALRADFICDVTITPRDDGSTAPLRLRPCDEDVGNILRRHFKELFTTTGKDTRSRKDFTCSAAHSLLCITAYGDVQPCIQVPISGGNIRAQRIKEIWERAQVFRDMRGMYAHRLRKCSRCEHRGYCRRCPGLAYLETGSLFGVSPEACRQSMLLARLLRRQSALH
jgi:radical SAM protein with 4Fe4S-binding SPASM domain